MNRREFLTVAMAAAAGTLTGCVSTPPRKMSPNSKLGHACIGVGGMGGHDLGNFTGHRGLQVVALCDVDGHNLEAAAKRVPGARRYRDWRELLAAEGDRIDSMNIAVPDHMHAAITLAALKARKHVYCQKPLCHDVAECRDVARAARKAGVVTQLGTQFAAGIGDRMAVHLLKQGAVGKVKRVVLCSNRASAWEYRLAGPRPAKGQPPPAHLAWDLWLGTAPEREYAGDIYHPMKWRSWQDFGTGWSGDIGCHIFDAVWKGLGLQAPISVVADVQESWVQSPERRADTWPQANHITWTFPGGDNIEGRELTVEWFDGDKFPPQEVQALALAGGFQKYPEEAALVIGTEGALLLPHQSGPVLLPKEKFANLPRPRLEGANHFSRFIDACCGGAPTESYFERVGPMTEAILLGTVAARMPGRVLQWDARRMRIPNAREAERFLRRDYRKGWA